MKSKGGVVLAVLALVLVMSTILGVAALQVMTQWKISSSVEKQLYAVSLSSSGIEYGRSLLQAQDPNEILKGRDGVFCSPGGERRDPVPPVIAHRQDLSSWNPACDDGYPFNPETKASLYRYDASEEASFWLRFSNNIEDSGEVDSDGIVVLRSLGIVSRSIPSSELPEFKNHAVLTEAAFRKESQFEVSAGLTLFTNEFELDFDGVDFVIDGGEAAAVGVIGLNGEDPVTGFVAGIDLSQMDRFRGRGALPSISDLTELYEKTPAYTAFFRPGFWRHLEQQLPTFARPLPVGVTDKPGLYRFAEGATLDRHYTGVLIGQGNLRLTGNALITGLLIHLGSGELSLDDQSVVEGGVWMSNVNISEEVLAAGPVSLSLADRSSIRFNRQAVALAMTCLPPTQIYWRMIFPETNR